MGGWLEKTKLEAKWNEEGIGYVWFHLEVVLCRCAWKYDYAMKVVDVELHDTWTFLRYVLRII